MGDPAGEQDRIDRLLDVTGEQEPAAGDLAEQDDRHVVDARSRVGRLLRYAAGRRPQDAQVDLVDPKPVARGEQASVRRVGTCQLCGERGEPRSRPTHAGLENAPDLVPVEQERDTGDVILVRMGDHDHVESPIPRRQAGVERAEQPVRVRPAVDEQPAAAAALDEDRVSLADVEDRDARRGRRGPDRRDRGHRHREPEQRDGEPDTEAPAAWSGRGAFHGSGR